MKYFIICSLAAVFTLDNVYANNSCEDPCPHTTPEQKECVLKHHCKNKTKLVTKIVEKRVEVLVPYEVETVIDNRTKNTLSLLALASPTKLKISQDASGYSANTGYEPDLGLMYQRDFDWLRGTIGVTLNGTGMLGLGVNF